MIAGLIAVLFLSGSSGVIGYIYDVNKIESGIKTLVVDEPRRSEALEVAQSMETSFTAYDNKVESIGEQMRNALHAQDALDSSLDVMWNQYLQDMDDYQRNFVDLRFELKEQLNREEWAAIFPANQ